MAKNTSKEISGEIRTLVSVINKLVEQNSSSATGKLPPQDTHATSKATNKNIKISTETEKKVGEEESLQKQIIELEKELSGNLQDRQEKILDGIQGWFAKEIPLVGSIIGGVRGLFKLEEKWNKFKIDREEKKAKLQEAKDRLATIGGIDTTNDRLSKQVEVSDKIFDAIDEFARNYFKGKKVSTKENINANISPTGQNIQQNDKGTSERAPNILDATKDKTKEGSGLFDSILGTLDGIKKEFFAKIATQIIGSLPTMLSSLGEMLLPIIGPAAIIGAIWTSVSDFLSGWDISELWGTSNIAGGLGGMIGGMSEGIGGAFRNMGKWAMWGVGIGMAGGPPGMIAGGLIGAAIGGILGFIGGQKIAKGFDWLGGVVRKLWSGFLGRLSKGYEFGNKIGGPIAGIASALIWGAYGGIIEWIRGSSVGKGLANIGEFVGKLFSSQTKHVSEGWEIGYGMAGPVGGVIGAILGGAFGGIIDWLAGMGPSKVIDSIIDWAIGLLPDWARPLLEKIRSGAKAVVSPVEKAGAAAQEAAMSQTVGGKNIIENKAAFAAAMDKQGITDPRMRAAMAATIEGESGWKMGGEQSYAGTSNERIRSIFKTKTRGMSDDQLNQLKANPQQFFNTVYSGTNGNVGANDGWTYRGRGYIQLTGRGNYEKYGKLAGYDLVKHPELMDDPKIAAEVSAVYMKERTKSGGDIFTNVKRGVGNAVAATEGVKNAAYQRYMQGGEFNVGSTKFTAASVQQSEALVGKSESEQKRLKDTAYQVFVGYTDIKNIDPKDSKDVTKLLDNPPDSWITKDMRNWGYSLYTKKTKFGEIPVQFQRGAYYLSMHPPKEWVSGSTTDASTKQKEGVANSTSSVVNTPKELVSGSTTDASTKQKEGVANSTSSVVNTQNAPTNASSVLTTEPQKPDLSTSAVSPSGEIVPTRDTSSMVSGNSGIIPVYVTNIESIASAISSTNVVSPKMDNSGFAVSNDTKALEKTSDSAKQINSVSGGNTIVNAPSISSTTEQNTTKVNSALNPNADIYKAVASAGTFLDFVQSVMPA